MTRRTSLGAAAVAVVGLLVVAALLVRTIGAGSSDGTMPDEGPWADPDVGAQLTEGEVPGGESARKFLDTYVDSDGRVVRTDQGGDTVSEGQAYAMLAAVGIGDQTAFDATWTWARENLRRPDGLLSFRWADGAVADPSSASDADLDAARALVVAAEVFDDERYRREGVELGAAVLEHETVPTSDGRVLVAGQWATTGPPWSFNPSYVSPVATRLLGEASGDPRWAELTTGSRAAVEAATPDGGLPPDWAQVEASGEVVPMPGPAGQPVQFGYDAARTLVRHAESCADQDQAYAAAAGATLGLRPSSGVYDLGGAPQTTDPSPLVSVAQAAGAAADEQLAPAKKALRRAAAESERTPTYYGDAWAALGPMMLASDVLGGCAPLEAS